jgi:hypothetical protein
MYKGYQLDFINNNILKLSFIECQRSYRAQVYFYFRKALSFRKKIIEFM